MVIPKEFLLIKSHFGSNFFKFGVVFPEVYFVYSRKGVLKITIVLTKRSFQKQKRTAIQSVFCIF